jgi:hypothetical protein
MCRRFVILFGVGWLVFVPVGAGERGGPGLPGVQERAWKVDPSLFLLFDMCMTGPASEQVLLACENSDADGDLDTDLIDVALSQPVFTGTHALVFDIATDNDDGTEIEGLGWYPDGEFGAGVNKVGRSSARKYLVGMRFATPWIEPGEEFVYGELMLPASDGGDVAQTLAVRIVGLAEDAAAPFSQVALAGRPRTNAVVDWPLTEDWPDGAGSSNCYPLWRYTPDIAEVVNEIVAQPGWGATPAERYVALVLEYAPMNGTTFVGFEDYREAADPGCPGRVVTPRLALYRTVRSSMAGRELLCRAADTSVDIHVQTRQELEVYVKYGTQPGIYPQQTLSVIVPAHASTVVHLAGLTPGTRYYYRLGYREPGDEFVDIAPERTFVTQAPATAPFTFTVTADTHLIPNSSPAYLRAQRALYQRCLTNIRQDAPDFHIDLGDTFFCGGKGGRDVLDLREAVDRHLLQREEFDLICHSVPFFLALGNHEMQCGWLLDGTPECVPVWAALARKATFPMPQPGGFFSGNVTPDPIVGYQENYYAFEWGDALFVVLDPFWNTTRCPHGTYGSGDRWDWTLGAEQYNWLAATLADSNAAYKFVFAHHVTGGMTTYGRGGIEAARHALGRVGSYEWGGESRNGTWEFDQWRPSWGQPIHDLFVAEGVTIFFHGHDHVFVHQVLDRVVYQACPQPSDVFYGMGFLQEAGYAEGQWRPNSGHLRVRVSPAETIVEYVRAFLPGDGVNGAVAFQHSMEGRGTD